MAIDKEWRKKELSVGELAKKYSNIPKSIILKMSIKHRGMIFTEAAKALFDPKIHQSLSMGLGLHNGQASNIPEGLTLADGSDLVFCNTSESEHQRDPYIVDEIDGKIYITDEGEPLVEAYFWEKPDFYDKYTSDGKPLKNFVSARPQRLEASLSHYCHFWDNPGEGCKYCSVSPNFLKYKKSTEERTNIDYMAEAFQEALKQKGRFSAVVLSGGSILSGEEPFDDEVDGYIELLQRIGENFSTKKFPSQLISTAFSEKQLIRLYENTGIMTYTADIEVLNKEKFNWICPGKARHVGFDEWKQRLYTAVDIFGKGNVNTAFVLGTELAKPNGFTDKEEAFKANLETAQELAEHGVGFAANIWSAAPNSIFANQQTPDLEYYVRFFQELDILARKHNLNRFIDDYRRCGSHIGNDLLRVI